MKDPMVKQYLWQGYKANVVMERKLNGFIQKVKDKLKMRKVCATQKTYTGGKS